MAAFHSSCLSRDLLSSLSAEVLYIILSYLPAKSLLNLSECNRRLRDLCQNCNSLWKHLCKVSCDSFDQKIKLMDRKVHLGSEEITFFRTIWHRKYNDTSKLILLSFCENSNMVSSSLPMGMLRTFSDLWVVNIELPVPMFSPFTYPEFQTTEQIEGYYDALCCLSQLCIFVCLSYEFFVLVDVRIDDIHVFGGPLFWALVFVYLQFCYWYKPPYTYIF